MPQTVTRDSEDSDAAWPVRVRLGPCQCRRLGLVTVTLTLIAAAARAQANPGPAIHGDSHVVSIAFKLRSTSRTVHRAVTMSTASEQLLVCQVSTGPLSVALAIRLAPRRAGTNL